MTAPFARKRFGQHFLVQPAIAERIVGLADLQAGATVLEIGPGRGALTALIAPRCARLVLIEVDRDLAAALRARVAATANVQLIEGDVLRVDLAATLGAHAPATVIANLPYNISTPVLMRLLGAPELFDRLVLMLQREVAARLCSAPGTKTYGALSVMVQAIAEPRIALRVPASAFAPAPKVESAVVVITPRRPPALDPARRRVLRGVVRTAFARRRKQLVNVIAPLTDDPHATLAALGLDPTARPETLTPAQFIQLADALAPAPQGPPAEE